MPVEYSGEDETISAVGLVQPRPGVFVAAIQYLLVVCTTIEVRKPFSLPCKAQFSTSC